MSIDSIFDDVIEETTVTPPITVLREVAQALEKKTQGLLTGEVEQYIQGSTVKLHFKINAPSLNNYAYEAVRAKHPMSFYPLTIEKMSSDDIEIQNQEEFEKELKVIFSSKKVKNVINGLLAQIKAA